MNTDQLTNQENSPQQDQPEESLNEQSLTARKLDEYLTDEKYAYQAPRRGDIREGIVVETSDNGVIIDIGSKREGIVPNEDLERLDEDVLSEIQEGERMQVYVMRPADREGRPVLSINQARMYEDWLKAEEMMESEELYEGEVSGYNRGGVIVRFGKIRGFVPASHIVGLPRRLREEQRRQRLADLVGEQMGLKIIEVDRKRRRLILSQRRAHRAWQELQRERVIEELNEGEVHQGRVTSITDFGAFVDLGGADGLIHVSELSWKRVEHPRDVLSVGDKIDVYVLKLDKKRKRIGLSLKKLQPDPWTLVDEHYESGQLVEGRVTRVLDFGAFIELDLGIEGLLHVREMIGTPELPPSEIVHPGEKLLVKIIQTDSGRRRIDLSSRQVQPAEWERWVAEQQAEEATAAEAETEEVATAEAETEEAASEPAEEELPVTEAGKEEEDEPTGVPTPEIAPEAEETS